jgi:hypothetical protein
MMFTSTIQGAFMPSRSNMTWEKSSQELIDLFTSLAPTAAGAEQKKMSGWPCWFVNGNLFAGLHTQSMIFRLPETDQAVFLKVGGYVILSEPVDRNRKELARWIDRSLQFAAALPPKAPKAASPRPTTKRQSKA